MAGVHVVERATKGGDRRFQVRMSGSRYEPITHLGTFPSRVEAERAASRARLMLDEGVLPTIDAVRAHRATPRRVSYRSAVEAWFVSRIDITESTRRTYTFLATHSLAVFGSRDVRGITTNDIQAWVGALKVEPRAAPKYLGIVKMVLDHAGVKPNPVAGVNLPYKTRREHRLPTRSELAAIHERSSDDIRLALLLLEHTGMRAASAAAARREHRDHARRRLLVPDDKTASGRRWIDDLPDYPDALVKLLDAGHRSSDYLLGGRSAGAIAAAMRASCERAGTRIYSPHDLRHLHASRLLAAGWNSADIARRLGHAHAGITLSVYSHSLLPD